MAVHHLSRLFRFKDVAFSLPKTGLVFAHIHPSTVPNFMFHKWAAPARAFCQKSDGEDGWVTRSYVPVIYRNSDKPIENLQSDKPIENAKGSAGVFSLLNQKCIADVNTFPPEILESEDRLLELFEAWMLENNRSYASKKQKLARFKVFKKNVFRVHKLNRSPDFQRMGLRIGLTVFADFPPDTFPRGIHFPREKNRRVK